jgi:S-(hydroxymethyl)glutathione synthase
MAAALAIHPSVDNGISPAAKDFRVGTLYCRCGSSPVAVAVKSQTMHNHACGCTKCWKPKGALFAMVAAVAREKITVVQNAEKLAVVDPTAPVQRYACKDAARTCTAGSKTRSTHFMASISSTRSCRASRVGRRLNLRHSCRRSSREGPTRTR